MLHPRLVTSALLLFVALQQTAICQVTTANLDQDPIQSTTHSESDKKSVKPGINEKFLDPNLDVSQWLGRFEIESREVYSARNQVLQILDIRPGMSVADVGAGTGFYSRLFAEATGPTGKVFAVDIAAKFLEHIDQKAREEQVVNITTVLCSDKSASLPPDSVDRVFICDTYHHFEYPESTLRSLLRAIKPGGQLVVIDFERIPGVSSEWTLGHVRAGKSVFRQEIEAAGFKFLEEVKLEQLKDNYLLRFERP